MSPAPFQKCARCTPPLHFRGGHARAAPPSPLGGQDLTYRPAPGGPRLELQERVKSLPPLPVHEETSHTSPSQLQEGEKPMSPP